MNNSLGFAVKEVWPESRTFILCNNFIYSGQLNSSLLNTEFLTVSQCKSFEETYKGCKRFITKTYHTGVQRCGFWRRYRTYPKRPRLHLLLANLQTWTQPGPISLLVYLAASRSLGSLTRSCFIRDFACSIIKSNNVFFWVGGGRSDLLRFLCTSLRPNACMLIDIRDQYQRLLAIKKKR